MIRSIVTKRGVMPIYYVGDVFSYNYGKVILVGPPTEARIVDFTAGKPFGRSVVIYAKDENGIIWKGVMKGWKGRILWT